MGVRSTVKKVAAARRGKDGKFASKKGVAPKKSEKQTVSKLKEQYNKGVSIADLAVKHRMTEAEVTAEVVKEVEE